MITDTQKDVLQRMEQWIRRELPFMNRSTEAHGDVRCLLNACRIRVDAIAFASRDVRDPQVALRMLQLLAFPVSSIERHLQAAGAAPGAGVDALKAAPVLMRLGEIAGHAPRDSVYTYCLLNDGELPLMFIGSSDEAMLIRAFNDMHRLQSASAAMLRPICNGALDVTTRMAMDLMAEAADNHDRVTMRLHNLLSPARRPAMELPMSARSLAMYWPDYPVDMQTFAGPDPANMPAQMEMALLIGAGREYMAQVRRRMPLLMHHDRMRLEAAMEQKSLAARIGEAAKLTEEQLMTMPKNELADRLESEPLMLDLLAIFAHLANSAETAASYFSAVMELFDGSASPHSQNVSNAKTLAQRATGRYDTLPQVVEFRRSHPTVRRLVAVTSR